MQEKPYLAWLKQNGVIILILIIAATLRLASAGTLDVYHDDALNAARAVGWFDYLSSVTQTTPVQWFTEPPAWSGLSFHDAPPVVFLIQHLFFAIFGESTLVLRLPFIIAGLALTLIIFIFLKRRRGLLAGVAGGAAFAVSSYATWTALAANLEGVQYLFIFLSLISCLAFFETNRRSKMFWGAGYLGLALLSKYTAIFIFPAIALYLIIFKRPLLTNKTFYKNIAWSLLILLTLLSPIIIYNYQMYQSRGHFDAALSSMVGMHPEDFKLISERSISFDPIANIVATWQTIFNNHSIPFAILFAISFLLLLTRLIWLRQKEDTVENFFVLVTLVLLALFAFLPPAPRLLSIITPFIAVIIGLAVALTWSLIIKSKWRPYRAVIIVVLILALGTELLYSINTNVLLSPLGPKNTFYSDNRIRALGFSELEKFFRTTLPVDLKEYRPQTMTDYREQSTKQTRGKPVFIYDGLTNWQGWFWHIYRYRTYNKVLIIPLGPLLYQKSLSQNLSNLTKISDSGIYFIETVGPDVRDSVMKQPETEIIVKRLLAFNTPITEIKNYLGEVVFRLYYIDTKTDFSLYGKVFNR